MEQRAPLSCKRCGHDDMVQKVSAIYAAGTAQSAYDGYTQSVGVVAGGLAVGRGYTHVRGGSQTILGQKLAPPTQPFYDIAWGARWSIWVHLATVDALVMLIVGQMVWSLLLVVPEILFILWAYMENGKRKATQAIRMAAYRKDMRLWSAFYYCHRCAGVFVPEDDAFVET